MLPVMRFQQRIIESLFGPKFWTAMRAKHAKVRKALREERRINDLGPLVEEEEISIAKIEAICGQMALVKECVASSEIVNDKPVIIVLIVVDEEETMKHAAAHGHQVRNETCIAHAFSTLKTNAVQEENAFEMCRNRRFKITVHKRLLGLFQAIKVRHTFCKWDGRNRVLT